MARLNNSVILNIIESANLFLKTSTNNQIIERRTIIKFVSELLISENCYRGFNYNYWTDRGYSEWVYEGKPETNKDYYMYGPSFDDSRVHFYI